MKSFFLSAVVLSGSLVLALYPWYSEAANPQVFDPPAKKITKEGWADIERRLEEPRRSFRFLR